MNLRLLTATTADVNKIAPLFDLYRVFYQQKSDLTLATQFISERLANKESTIFYVVDEASGNALGFTQLYPTFSSVSAQKSLVLNDLFVDEKARGLGVSRLLMEAAREFGVKSGAKGIALETAANNVVAQSLYESLGYVKDDDYFHYFLAL